MSETQPIRVQRFARGLLGLLGAQTQGTAPPYMAGSLVGTVDASIYLEFSQQTLISASQSVSAVGHVQMFAPGSPGTAWQEDYLWQVTEWGWIGTAVLAAGVTIGAAPAIQARGLASFPVDGNQTWTVGAAMAIAHRPTKPLLLSRDDNVGIYVTTYAGAATAGTKWCRYTRLE